MNNANALPDPVRLEAVVTPRTKAAVVVDLDELDAELDRFQEVAENHGIAKRANALSERQRQSAKEGG